MESQLINYLSVCLWNLLCYQSCHQHKRCQDHVGRVCSLDMPPPNPPRGTGLLLTVNMCMVDRCSFLTFISVKRGRGRGLYFVLSWELLHNIQNNCRNDKIDFQMVPKFDEFRSKLNVMMMQEVAILKCNHDQCILCHVESDIPASALECLWFVEPNS